MGRQLSTYLIDEDQKKKEEILKSKGVSRVHYSYLGTDVFNNVFSCCSMVDENNKLLSRGISICSTLDQHNKKVARTKTFGRALKALLNEENSLEIAPGRKHNFPVPRKRKFDTMEDAQEFAAHQEIFEPKIGNKDNKGRIVLHYKVYFNDPVEIAAQFFQYKSEFKPSPAEFEVDLHKVEV